MFEEYNDRLKKAEQDVRNHFWGARTDKTNLGFYGASDALYGAATDREALCVVVGMLSAGASGDKVMAHIKAYLEGKR